MPISILDLIVDAIRTSEKSLKQISRESGVARSTLESWIGGHVSPSLFNAEAVLGTIGYTLILQKTEISDGGNCTESESDTLSA